MVRYRRLYFKSRDNELVSRQWFVLLFVLHRKRTNVDFNVNEGKRTYRRQWQLVRQYGLWSPSNPTGAARPSPFAPHIRVGRPDHAVDFDNAAAVVVAAHLEGVTLNRPIPQEPWHVEADRESLRKFYKKNRKWVFKEVREIRRQEKRDRKKNRKKRRKKN